MDDSDRERPRDGDEDYRAYVTARLETFSEVLCEVADGNYDVFARSERDDEFGDMAMMINVLVNSVRRSVEREKQEALRANEVASRQEQLLSELEDKLDIIERQKAAIHELSTPVLELWNDVLALPIIGVIDTRRSMEIMERLLDEISRKRARFVILDITGVEVVDTKTADHFIKVVKAAGLLGTTCILTGIRPAVAQTLVEIGIDLDAVITRRNLMQGLEECMRRMKNGEHRRASGVRTRDRGPSSPDRQTGS